LVVAGDRVVLALVVAGDRVEREARQPRFGAISTN